MTVPIPPLGQVLETFGGPLDVRVEIDTGEGPDFVGGLWDVGEWDVDVWGASDPSWFDMTAYVEDVGIARGAERWGQRFRTGTARILVDNTSGIFTPGSGVSMPWIIPFRPGRRVRVVVIHDGDPENREPVFTGALDESQDQFGMAGFEIKAELSCSDFMALWQASNPLALDTPTGVQTTDERVEAALDRMGWPADLRDIQAGEHTMLSSFLAQPALEECARAAEAEGGAFFCEVDGTATFKARDWLTTDTRSTEIQGYLGYDEIPIGAQAAHVLEFKTSWQKARIINQVSLARTGGEAQTADDPSSIELYDPATYQMHALENADDADVLFLAERLVEAAAELRLRIDEVTINGVADPDNDDLNRLLWATRFGDLLAVKVEPPFGWSFERLVQVWGISHHITADDWEVTLKLDDSLTEILS